jgi:hypothetical protein
MKEIVDAFVVPFVGDYALPTLIILLGLALVTGIIARIRDWLA